MTLTGPSPYPTNPLHALLGIINSLNPLKMQRSK